MKFAYLFRIHLNKFELNIFGVLYNSTKNEEILLESYNTIILRTFGFSIT